VAVGVLPAHLDESAYRWCVFVSSQTSVDPPFRTPLGRGSLSISVAERG
jgi:hypothetical protein